MKKKILNKNFIEGIIFSKFGQKRHGWAKICQIVTYFSFLPTMTFFFPNVMVDENLSDFQLIWFFTTMTFFFGKCHFFFKNVMVGKIFRNIKFQSDMSWLNKNFMSENFMNLTFLQSEKKRRSAPGPLGDFFIVSFKNSVSFYLVKKVRKLPSILYDNCLQIG